MYLKKSKQYAAAITSVIIWLGCKQFLFFIKSAWLLLSTHITSPSFRFESFFPTIIWFMLNIWRIDSQIIFSGTSKCFFLNVVVVAGGPSFFFFWKILLFPRSILRETLKYNCGSARIVASIECCTGKNSTPNVQRMYINTAFEQKIPMKFTKKYQWI